MSVFFFARESKLFPVYFAGFNNIKSGKKTENNLDARAKKNTDICIPHI